MARRGRRERFSAPADAPEAGRFRALTDGDVSLIDEAARDILARIGLSDAPPAVVELATSRGAGLTGNGRLTFARPLVDAALSGLSRGFTLHGRDPAHALTLTGARVHCGTGGAAPLIVDLDTGAYRPSTLADLHAAARVADALPHIRFFSRSLVARNMETAELLDINTAYASMAGTAKHVMTSVSDPAHVPATSTLCHLVAGGADAFANAPFLSLNVNHVTPPLRFAPEAVEVLVAAVRTGLPVHCNTFGQMGASSPVTMAGCLAQTMAETLAGAVLAWIANPEARVVFGPRPMVTDLRTGAMAGGGGEQALLMAASVQMARHYGLANSCIAGATDSKAADAQSGHEKALSIALAVQSGANLVTQAAGMQAGLMGASLAAYVIDDEMVGAILRSARPIEVDRSTLAIDDIAAAVRGEGHFLGHAETLARMESDFVYPALGDRDTPEMWERAGRPALVGKAKERVREILAEASLRLEPEADRAIRARFDIRLPGG